MNFETDDAEDDDDEEEKRRRLKMKHWKWRINAGKIFRFLFFDCLALAGAWPVLETSREFAQPWKI